MTRFNLSSTLWVLVAEKCTSTKYLVLSIFCCKQGVNRPVCFISSSIYGIFQIYPLYRSHKCPLLLPQYLYLHRQKILWTAILYRVFCPFDKCTFSSSLYFYSLSAVNFARLSKLSIFLVAMNFSALSADCKAILSAFWFPCRFA